jgi:hypothetical protein
MGLESTPYSQTQLLFLHRREALHLAFDVRMWAWSWAIGTAFRQARHPAFGFSLITAIYIFMAFKLITLVFG